MSIVRPMLGRTSAIYIESKKDTIGYGLHTRKLTAYGGFCMVIFC